jgi:hypothetical protein
MRSDIWNARYLNIADLRGRSNEAILARTRPTCKSRRSASIVLISADFFASDFIDESELLPLLAAAQAKGVRILPVILSASRFARDPSLARFQAVNSPDRPLNKMSMGEQEEVLDRLARTIEAALDPR